VEKGQCDSSNQSSELIESYLHTISLTTTRSNLLESLICSWILNRIQVKLDVRQYGALTTHGLVDMLHQWHEAVDEGQSMQTVFIDFAKSFDCVDHNILITKLTEFGLPDAVIQWLRSFLCHRRQRVKIGDVVSDWLVIDAGMPHGSYLGPLTFVTLVDSLQSSCMTHKYVDDTTLSEIIVKSTTSHMQIYCNEVVQQSEQLVE